MSNLVTDLIKEYQRRLVLRRRLGHALAPPEATTAAPKPMGAPRLSIAGPHAPTPDYKLRESQL